MIVYGVTFDAEDNGKELFKGSLEECRKFVEDLDPQQGEWYSLSIDKDNGEIEERIISAVSRTAHR